MAFYPAKGNNKKYVLNRPLNVIGASFIGNATSNHTISISRTDADFIVAAFFYKSGTVNSTFTIDGENSCFGMTDELGSSFEMAGRIDVVNKNMTTAGRCTISWSARNTVDYVCNESVTAGVMIWFCKNV